MNDPRQPALSAMGLDANGAPVSAGALLRQRREAAGIDTVMLASTLKVTPQKIQALEEDRYDDLPNLSFARSLASTVCRALGIDSAPVLALMPHAAPEMPVRAFGARPDFNPGGGGASRASVPGWLVVVVVLLLAGALTMKFWPEHSSGGNGAAPQAAGSATESAAQLASEVASEAASNMAIASAALDAALLNAPAGSPPAASAVTPAVTPIAAAASSPVSSAPDPDDAQNDASATEGSVMSFSASGPVWVSVRDHSGKIVLGRTLSEGEQVDAGGQPPLTVVVGDKNNVSVTVRGQPFNLDKHVRPGGAVARFTIGPAADDNP